MGSSHNPEVGEYSGRSIARAVVDDQQVISRQGRTDAADRLLDGRRFVIGRDGNQNPRWGEPASRHSRIAVRIACSDFPCGGGEEDAGPRLRSYSMTLLSMSRATRRQPFGSRSITGVT